MRNSTAPFNSCEMGRRDTAAACDRRVATDSAARSTRAGMRGKVEEEACVTHSSSALASRSIFRLSATNGSSVCGWRLSDPRLFNFLFLPFGGRLGVTLSELLVLFSAVVCLGPPLFSCASSVGRLRTLYAEAGEEQGGRGDCGRSFVFLCPIAKASVLICKWRINCCSAARNWSRRHAGDVVIGLSMGQGRSLIKGDNDIH